MTVVEIEGVGRVKLDDNFRTLPPEEQSKVIEEIVQQAGGTDPKPTPAQDYAQETGNLATEYAGQVGRSALGIGRQFTGGFNEALGRLAGGMAEVDPIERGLEFAGERLGFEPPRTPVRALSDMLRGETMAGPDPTTPAQRIVRRSGEVLGETVAPAGAVAGLARAGVGAALGPSASVGQRAASSVLDTVRAAPRASMAIERTGAIGAGLAGGTAREVAPGNRAAELGAEIVGGIAAPLATAYSSPALALRGAGAIKRAVTDRFTEEGQARRAADFIGSRLKNEMASDTARGNMDRAARVREEIPGFEPSLAQQTDLPSLRTTQQNLEAKASGPAFDQAVSRHAANREAVERFRQQAAPSGEPSAEDALRPLVADREMAGRQLRSLEQERARLDQLRKDAAEFVREQRSLTTQSSTSASIQRAEDAANVDTAMRALTDQEATALSALDNKLIQEKMDLAQGVRPSFIVDRKLLGGRIRGELLAERSARSEDMNRLARDLGINDADMSLSFQNFQRKVSDWQSSLRLPTQRENMPNALRDVQALAEKVDAGAPLTFQDVKALRESITDELIDLARDTRPGSRKRLANGAQLKALIDDVLLGDELKAADPAFAASYAEFRKRYFEDFIKPFEQGTVLDAKKTDGSGFYRTLDEEVATEFLSSQEAARQFQSILGTNRQALGDLTAVAMDGLADAAIRDGMITSRGLDTWITRHRGALQELPEIKAVVDRLKADTDAAMEQYRLAEQMTRQRVGAERSRLIRERDATTRGRIEDRRTAQERELDIAEQYRAQDDELRAAQQKLDEALTPLRERMGLLTERQMAREDQTLARRIAAIEGGQKQEDDVIREALQSPRLMMRLTSRLSGEPQAMASLRRKVWDDLGQLGGQQIDDFMAANDKSLRMVFSDRHMDNLKTMADALKMLEAVPPPTRGQAIGTDVIDDLRRSTGFNPMQASSRFVNIKSGRLSARVAGFDFLMRTLNARRTGVADQLMRDALYNPQVAEALMSRMTPEAAVRPPRAITAWLATRGILYPTEDDDGN